MDWEGGNKEKIRKCREWISLHFLFIFSFSLHFLTARLPGCHKLCNPVFGYNEWRDNCFSPKTSWAFLCSNIARVFNCIIWMIANNSLGIECLQKQEPAILLSHTGRLNEVNSKFRVASSANHQKDQEGQHFVCLAIFQINQPTRSLFSKSSKTNQQGQSFVIWKWSKTN